MPELLPLLSTCTKLQELHLSCNALPRCLSSFLPDPHPGLPELEKINLGNEALHKEDQQHFLSIVNKLPKLKILDLSHNQLEGCLSRFLPDPHPGLPNLHILDIDNARLTKQDLHHLLGIAHKLPKLLILRLSHYTLTGCMSSFLPDPYPGLPELTELWLPNTSLNKDDLQHLLKIIMINKLPRLRWLDLSLNNLRGCLTSFLPDSHSRLPELEELYVTNAALTEEDLKHLLHIIYKLPKLRYLYLSVSTLTGCLSNFLPDPYMGLMSLEVLYLDNTALNKEDMQHLSKITQCDKLPSLEQLNLSSNNLKKCMSYFLPDPHPGLPQLLKLYLDNTALNKNDVQHHGTAKIKLAIMAFLFCREIVKRTLFVFEQDSNHIHSRFIAWKGMCVTMLNT